MPDYQPIKKEEEQIYNKKKRVSIEESITIEDIRALKIVRDKFFEGDWRKLDNSTKKKWYERIKSYLLEFPIHINLKEPLAISIQNRLLNEGLSIEQALKGVEYIIKKFKDLEPTERTQPGPIPQPPGPPSGYTRSKIEETNTTHPTQPGPIPQPPGPAGGGNKGKNVRKGSKFPPKTEPVPQPPEPPEEPPLAFLTARAYIKEEGRSKPQEIENAVLEEPRILAGRTIPFDNVPLPAGHYNLLARYESPDYGSLEARVEVTLRPGERRRVEFIFIAPPFRFIDRRRTEEDSRCAFLTLRAYLRIGRRRPQEINAVLEEPVYFPEIFREENNRIIPNNDLPVPPGHYRLLARYDSPDYGPLKERVEVTLRPGERRTVNFIFRVPGSGGGGGRGRRTTQVSIQNISAIQISLDDTSTTSDGARYPVGAVEGRVVDENGNPVTGAVVVVTAVNGREYSGETDDNGEFFIDNVPASRIPWQPGTRVEACPVYVYMEYFDEVAHAGEPRRAVGQTTVVITAGEVNRCRQDPIRINMRRRSREEEIQHYYDTTRGGRPVGFRGPSRGFGLATLPFRAVSRRLRREGFNLRSLLQPLILIVIGIAVTAATGNYWFMAGFLFLALHIIFPDPGEIRLLPEDEVVDHETGRIGGPLRLGSFWANAENRTTVGIAFLRALGEMGYITCFTIGLYRQQFPLSNLILLIFVFFSYFRLPVDFQPTRPYDFIRSFFRVLLALFIAIFVFGAFGGGIFKSKELGWLTLAFFVVLPVARERENLARALGILGSASGEAYEVLDKIIFLAIMLIFAIGYGFSFAGGGFFSGSTSAIIFSSVWVLGLVSGLMTPAETRPYMGIIVLSVAFVVFGIGAGEQAMGVAFFGQWWPVVHNTATEFFKPVGELFMQFQNTFGHTWLLFTNPVGYAQQIIQGQYAKNEMGVEGAYGLEIRKFQVQSIYINEPFMIEIELENKGMYKARNIKLDILTNMEITHTIRRFNQPTIIISYPLFKISNDGTNYENMKYAYEDKYEKRWYKYTVNLNEIERGEIVPIVLYGKVSCEDFDKTAWRDAGIIFRKEHTAREYYVPFVANITYEYDAESNLQIDFISVDEWKRLSLDNKLVRENKPSLISTSPASLNLGTMDQPIREDLPFFIGFNLTTTWPQKTIVSGGIINIKIPKEFGSVGAADTCSRKPNNIYLTSDNNYWIYIFDLSKSESKSVFCNYDRLKDSLKAPKKTFVVQANATYNFSKWEQKDTLFNFRDVCYPLEGAIEIDQVACKDIPSNFKNAFNTYKEIIQSSVGNDIERAALVAAIITQESSWDKNALSECASAGIAQFTPQTARSYGLNVFDYDFVPISQTSCKAKVEKISSCYKGNEGACCTLSRQDCTDERFIPEKAIPAMAKLLDDLIKRCGDSGGTYEAAIRAYNMGPCNAPEATDYYNKVSSYYNKWLTCLTHKAS